MKTGRTIVITGAAGGMGRLFVARFLENGDTVIATDMTEESLAGLRTSGRGALHTLAADLTDANDIDRITAPGADFVTGQSIVVDGGNTML